MSQRAWSREDAGRAVRRPRVVKFNAVRRGTCQLEVDGIDEPIDLAEVTVYLLTRPRSFTLAAIRNCSCRWRSRVPRAEDGIARASQGDDVFLIGGGFSSAPAPRAAARQAAPIVHVPADTRTRRRCSGR
ncbi:cupin domain-containing protein [Streptomyces lividans]